MPVKRMAAKALNRKVRRTAVKKAGRKAKSKQASLGLTTKPDGRTKAGKRQLPNTPNLSLIHI